MMLRLYYWYEGAPAERPGGPWWYRSFINEESLQAFLAIVAPFCREMRLLRRAQADMPNHDPMNIEPPEDAEALHVG